MIMSFVVSDFNKRACVLPDSHVQKRLLTCAQDEQKWESDPHKDVHALEYRALGAFATRAKGLHFPIFLTCSNDEDFDFINGELAMIRYVFRNAPVDFNRLPVHKKNSYHSLGVCRFPVADYEKGVRASLDGYHGLHSASNCYSNRPREINYPDMILIGVTTNAIRNAGVYIKDHLMIIVKRAISRSDLLESVLCGFKLHEDIIRIWGLPNSPGRRKVPIYSRLVIEVPREKTAEILSKIKSQLIPKHFHKAYLLCYWCQLAEGNEKPELIKGKPKDRLFGASIQFPTDIRVNPWPACECKKDGV